MTSTKTVMLAGFAALSLGVASANAQGLMPSAGEANYFRAHDGATGATMNRGAGQEQSGSSDVATMHSGSAAGAPVHYGHGTIANPG